MEIAQIDWKRIKPKIGRWVRTEAHAGQVKYDLESDLADPFTITQFTVDFEDEKVTDGWREELGGYQEAVPLTDAERSEALQMISDCRIITINFHVKPDKKEEAVNNANVLKRDYEVKMTINDDIAAVKGNHRDIAAAITDGVFDDWAVEDAEVEHDKACGLPKESWGNWEY